MSPEQAEGKPVDARSDLFSLGVMLYELASGERPFKGDTSLSVLSAILRDTPASVTALRADLPREFGRIVKRCLQKDPEERYQTAKDVRADLKALRAEVDSGEVEAAQAMVAGTGKAPKRRVPRWALGLAALVVVSVAGAFVAWQLPRAPVTPPSRPFESISLRRLTTQGSIRAAAISPDGKYVAFAASEGRQQALAVRQIATAVDRVVVPPGSYWYHSVSFSRDGSYLFFVRRARGEEPGTRTLYQVSVLGGDPRKVLDDVYSAIAQSPDGGRVAFVRGDPERGPNSLMVARVDGSDLRQLASRPWPRTYDTEGPAWSPDGRWIAVGGYQGEVGVSSALVVVSAEDGSERQIGPASWGAMSQLAWHPDGSGLLMAAADATTNWFYQLWFVSFPEGQARRISADPNSYASMSVSADGLTALTLQSDWLSTVWMAPAGDPRRAAPVTDGRYDGFGGLAWAGKDTIVFGTRDWGIWSVWADGRNRKLLTVGENNNRGPCVPRDDTRVIFFESWRTPAGIWRMDLDGGNVRLVVKEEGLGGLECTPDGQWLLFQTAPSEIRRVRVDGTPAPPLEARIAGPLAVSPDGRRIAYLYPDPTTRKFRIDVIPFGGGAAEKTFDAPSGAGTRHAFLRWTPDGRALSYEVMSAGVVGNIWMQQVSGGSPTPVTDFSEDLIWYHAWAADGRLALARGRVEQDIVLITSEGRK
jgi:WD40 repeat protein